MFGRHLVVLLFRYWVYTRIKDCHIGRQKQKKIKIYKSALFSFPHWEYDPPPLTNGLIQRLHLHHLLESSFKVPVFPQAWEGLRCTFCYTMVHGNSYYNADVWCESGNLIYLFKAFFYGQTVKVVINFTVFQTTMRTCGVN